MNIKPIVYESLTPHQRVIATIEAEARGDDAEVKRLVATCPKKNYTQTDAAYSDMMAHLTTMSIAIETDIRGHVIGALIAMMVERDDALKVFLQKIANLRAAWDETLKAKGIDPDTMRKFTAPLEHQGIKFIEDFLPEPETGSKAMVEIAEAMRELMPIN